MTKDGVYLQQKNIMKHEDQVNAIRMAIKPGFLNIFCKLYTFEMIVAYFIQIKQKKIFPNEISIN